MQSWPLSCSLEKSVFRIPLSNFACTPVHSYATLHGIVTTGQARPHAERSEENINNEVKGEPVPTPMQGIPPRVPNPKFVIHSKSKLVKEYEKIFFEKSRHTKSRRVARPWSI
jgi:hypothetical protein